MMRANPFVCFEVEEIEDLASWRTVVAWGEFEELDGDAAERALRLLVDRFASLVTSVTARPAADTLGEHRHRDGPAPVLYRIVLEQKTGRFESR
jgi:nitroimidazol reductase NimA-like FMN-containing flavoprotein (pyridoxamine 5'-phosphate oxidase superfamily)